MDLSHGVFQLKGVVQHYAWGGYDYIPNLLKEHNEAQKPFAEYWLGAHPNFPAKTIDDVPLDKIISAQPSLILGKKVAKKYTGLPYLFKVLDVRQMLSIQVHPDKNSAKKEFESENSLGIAMTASNRNYKDDNHKPELMVALGDFFLLHGFKTEHDLTLLLENIPEFQFLNEIFEAGNYQALFETVMLMPQEKVNEHLEPLVNRILPVYQQNGWQKNQENFWAARAATTFCKPGFYDRGIFCIYFLNLVHLNQGEGVFQPPGMPHAYLEGQNVEVMANSDNVLRAGLTDKHVAVQELLRYINFTSTKPVILSAEGWHSVYKTEAEEFELHHYLLDATEQIKLKTASAEILFILEGSLTLFMENRELKMQKGGAVLIAASHEYIVIPASGASLYRVTVPEAEI